MRGKPRSALAYLILLTIVLCPFRTWADQADLLYKEGLRLEEKGQRDFAVFKYFAITRNYPNSKWADEALFKIAVFYYENKDYFNAKESFEKLIKQYPQSGFAAESKQYLGNIAGMFRKSDFESGVKKVISDIENLKSEGKWDDIATECDKLSALEGLPDEYNTKLLEYYKLCADAYLKNEELGKAKIVYEKVIKITPDDTEVLNRLYEINKLLKTAPKVESGQTK